MASRSEPPPWQPANPDFERAVRDRFGQQGFLATIGAWLVEVAPGRTMVELPYSARLAHQPGHFHGAIVGAIGDSAGGHAALSLLAAGDEVVTAECKINFVRPARGELLRAEGQVVSAGRSLVVVRVDIVCVAGGVAKTCGLLQGTFMRVKAMAP